MAAVPDRERAGRLREMYWLSRAESRSGGKSFINLHLFNWVERGTVDKRRDEPGDGFLYLARMIPKPEDSFEWLEVTEVFTTVPAGLVEGAMETWHGIPGKRALDFEDFLAAVPRGRPSRVEQRRAADRVISQIEKKLAKSSYRELLEKFGYGTLVVGLPLWFAVPPDDPYRAENSVDDFMTRTSVALEEIRKGVLVKPGCPFRKIVVIWDTTPEALRSWGKRRSAVYNDAPGVSLNNQLGWSFAGTLSDALERAVSKAAVAECDAPSVSLHLTATTKKKALGTGPYPELVTVLGKELREWRGDTEGPMQRMKSKAVLALWRVLCFGRIRRVEGLVRWSLRRFSVSHAVRMRTLRRKSVLLYLESRRRSKVFRGRDRAGTNRFSQVI